MRFSSSTAQSLAWLEFIINNSLKLTLLAFTYGFLIDLLLKKQQFQTIAAFLGNIKSFLGLILTLSALPYLIHFILFITSNTSTPFHTIQIIFQPVVTIICLRSILMKKGPVLISKAISGSKLCVIIAAIGIFYATYALYFLTPDTLNALKSLAIFLLKYSAFWIFLVFANNIIDESYTNPKPTQEHNEIILISLPLGGLVQGILSIAATPYPFVFAIIKALTPSKYTFREYNRIAWRNDFYKNNCLVAITCLTNNAMLAYKIAKGFRQHGSKVVIGGPHVTAFPDEALEYCDAVVIGPIESVWSDIIHDYEKGTLNGKYAVPPTEKDYTTTANALMAQSPYIAYHCLETTRGCKFNCYFCGGGHLKIGYHQHSIETTLSMIRKAAQHSKTLIFVDDNIYSNPAYTKKLFEQMRPLNIRWKSSSSLDIAKDPEAVRLCKESGCVELIIGYETFPGSKEAGKGKFAMANEYIQLTNVLKKAGINVKGNFIYGFDSDDFFSFWKLWAFMNRLSLRSTQISLFTPTPNSRFYQDIDDNDRFINLNWNRLDAMTLMFDHPRLNNPLFRDGFTLVSLFMLATTCWFGRSILAFVILYISMGWL